MHLFIVMTWVYKITCLNYNSVNWLDLTLKSRSQHQIVTYSKRWEKWNWFITHYKTIPLTDLHKAAEPQESSYSNLLLHVG